MHRGYLAGLFATLLCFAGSGCGHQGAAGNASELTEVGERRVMLLGETGQPAFYLGPEADAPAVGFGNPDAKLIVRGPSQGGRTPIRVHGRLSVEAYVPDELFELRAQRRLAITGTPVLAVANNRVRLRGAAGKQGLIPVAARVQVGDVVLGPFEGTVPIEALAANSPQEADEPLSRGIAYRLPPETALPLYHAPQGELITLVAPQAKAQTIQVLAVQGAWFMVRLGSGPYLEGYTNASLNLLGTPLEAAAQPSPQTAPRSEIPRRIAQAAGPLKRVPANTRVTFRGKPLATFRSEGWARVLGDPKDGKLEVLTAADDNVTVRGLVPADSLIEADPSAVEAAPATATTGVASELSSAFPESQSTTVNRVP